MSIIILLPVPDSCHLYTSFCGSCFLPLSGDTAGCTKKWGTYVPHFYDHPACNAQKFLHAETVLSILMLYMAAINTGLFGSRTCPCDTRKGLRPLKAGLFDRRLAFLFSFQNAIPAFTNAMPCDVSLKYIVHGISPFADTFRRIHRMGCCRMRQFLRLLFKQLELIIGIRMAVSISPPRRQAAHQPAGSR